MSLANYLAGPICESWYSNFLGQMCVNYNYVYFVHRQHWPFLCYRWIVWTTWGYFFLRFIGLWLRRLGFGRSPADILAEAAAIALPESPSETPGGTPDASPGTPSDSSTEASSSTTLIRPSEPGKRGYDSGLYMLFCFTVAMKLLEMAGWGAFWGMVHIVRLIKSMT